MMKLSSPSRRKNDGYQPVNALDVSSPLRPKRKNAIYKSPERKRPKLVKSPLRKHPKLVLTVNKQSSPLRKRSPLIKTSPKNDLLKSLTAQLSKAPQQDDVIVLKSSRTLFNYKKDDDTNSRLSPPAASTSELEDELRFELIAAEKRRQQKHTKEVEKEEKAESKELDTNNDKE